MNRREKFQVYNTLVAVPMMLIGKAVLIDLKNETSVAGRIVNVDGYMNINLNEVVFIDQKGLQYEFDEFMAPTRVIRQIHIPDSLDASAALNNYFEEIGRKNTVRKNPRQNTFKVKRALRKHKEILEEIAKSK